MDKVMNVDPGLMIWTLITFFIFFGLLTKFATKPIMAGLKKREDSIQESIENAEKANADAQKLLKESQEKIRTAQQEMMGIVNKGRQQAEEIIKKALDEAELVKKQKIDETVREINRSKDNALKELRGEVADLVIFATEKILDETLDKEKHFKLVQSYIEKLPNN